MTNQLNLAGQKLTGLIDRFNDRFTSYRLMLYFLIAVVGWAIFGSFFKQTPFSWHEILISASFLVAVCWLTNKLISSFLDIPANQESSLITGLILSLILSPPTSLKDFALVGAAGVAAIATKFIITVYKSHMFNPAASGAFVAGELFHQYPSWWVGTKFITPIIVLGGILILRKMKRYIMVLSFLAVYILWLIYGNSSGGSLHFLWLEIISTPVIFFAVVMLIEPLTSPTLLQKYLPYAVLVALLYSITRLKFSPEEALLVGNLFTFIVATNRCYELKFIRQIKEAEGIYSYIFALPRGFKFRAGQYMEWTIAHSKSDSRGNRRYLTISSAPSEPGLMITVKQPANPSVFKQQLSHLQPGQTILAGHTAGTFSLPKDPAKKLAFMAGGVGITPFRSMIKHLVDSGERRDLALFYSVNSAAELSFKGLFDRARHIGLKPNYITEEHIDEAKIKVLLPDYRQRTFYISGPYGFVQAVESAVLRLGVPLSQIVVDYFPGYGG